MPTAIEAHELSKRYRIGQMQAAYGTLRDSLVGRGLARVGCFTPERTAQQLVEGYGTVLGTRS